MALPIGEPRPCKGCGKTIDRKKFCSNDCRDDWYQRTAIERGAAKRLSAGIRPRRWLSNLPPSRCKECGAEYPTRTGRTETGFKEYCSKVCAAAKRKLYASEMERIAVGKVRARRRRGVRPMEAYRRDLKLRSAERAVLQHAQVAAKLSYHLCASCWKPLHSLKLKYCSACSGARAKAAKRASRKAYKVRQRGVTVELFDPLEVLRRDGWKCHLCGRKTPERYRGTFRDDAPELDHIIPLAQGGEHSRRNTACACRKCNITKGSKIIGQASLLSFAA